YRRLRGGGGPLILSLASGDFVVSVLHILPAFSSFNNKWAFGNVVMTNTTSSGCDVYMIMDEAGVSIQYTFLISYTRCSLYGASVGLCGIASLLTLSAIAADRFSVIVGHPLLWLAGKKICVAIWLVSLALTCPPFFGWSRYCLEGLGTSCSWDYNSRDFHNRLYYIFLLTVGFVVPVSIITVSYLGILWVVCKQKSQLDATSKVGALINKKKPTKNDIKTAQILGINSVMNLIKGLVCFELIIFFKIFRDAKLSFQWLSVVSIFRDSCTYIRVIFTIIICFLIAWTPYAIASLIGQFGDESNPLSRLGTAIPAIFAKTSVVFNPIVYGISHPHFRSAVRTLHARRFGSKPCRRQHHGNNKEYYQYNYHPTKFGERYAPAMKHMNLYDGTCNGSGERMRRETRRQRQTWNLQQSNSTKMMSEMTTTGQNNRSKLNMLLVIQNTSALQKHLLFFEKSGELRVQDLHSVSRCTSRSSPDQHEGSRGKKKELIHSSEPNISARSKKDVKKGQIIVLDENKRNEPQACYPSRNHSQMPFSQSESCLALVPNVERQLNGSISFRRNLSSGTNERNKSQDTVNNNIKCYQNLHGEIWNRHYCNFAFQETSLSTGDCLEDAFAKDRDILARKCGKSGCSRRVTPKRMAYKQRFHLDDIRRNSKGSNNTFNSNFKKIQLDSKFPRGSAQQRRASTSLFEEHWRKDFALNHSRDKDLMNTLYLKKNKKKSTWNWRHKLSNNAPRAKKMFWASDKEQVVFNSNVSVTNNYMDLIPDYCSSFI
ncbi:unnamed protein product, partial [Allacma fusca]